MSDLHVDFLGKRLAGPVIPASGTFGFGEEYADMYDLSVLGGICSKGLTLNGKYGNEGERLYETPAGLINSIGLQNPGERCIIAEDVVTTGISSLETKRVIEEAGGVCLGIACVVDRTKADAPSPIPIVASAAKLDLPNYLPEECPICAEGKLPLVHLGSRKMKEQAKQTL